MADVHAVHHGASIALATAPDRKIPKSTQKAETVAHVQRAEGGEQRKEKPRPYARSRAETAREENGEVTTHHQAEERSHTRVRHSRRGGRAHRRDERRWHYLAYRHHASNLARDERLEISVLVIRATELSQRRTRVVPDDDAWIEKPPTAMTRESVVELVILVPHELLIEHPDATEELAAIASEGNGVDPLPPARTDPKVRVTDA